MAIIFLKHPDSGYLELLLADFFGLKGELILKTILFRSTPPCPNPTYATVHCTRIVEYPSKKHKFFFEKRKSFLGKMFPEWA